MPPKPTHIAHSCSLDPIRIHCSIFWISLPSTDAHLWVILVREPLTFITFFPLHFIIHLERALVGTSTCIMGGASSNTSKKPSWTNFDEKFIDCSNTTRWKTSGSTILISTSFFSKSLMTMKKVCQRSRNVSSSPLPIMATHCKVSRNSFFMFRPSLELFLDSWNVGGGLDANGFM